MHSGVGGSVLDLHRGHVALASGPRCQQPHHTALLQRGQRIHQGVGEVVVAVAEPQQDDVDHFLFVLIDQRLVKMILQEITQAFVNVIVDSDLLNQMIRLQAQLDEKVGVVYHIGGGIILLFHTANVTRIRRGAGSATPLRPE